MRKKIKQIILSYFKRILVQDEIKQTLVDSLRNPFLCQLNNLPEKLTVNYEQPYADLGNAQHIMTPERKTDVVLITGRFRSGSTFLWNIFRSLPGITAYYEPFNENQWFNPQVADKGVDKTHRKVENYDQEYHGLNSLTAFYREDWIREHLYMDEHFYAPDMLDFIKSLIDHASGRPLLQFNRIDFRLPWIRANFPQAKIIHIYRYPRDQWCSSLLEHLSSFTCDGSMEEFVEYDGFYLRMWAQDLKYHFPFLDERLVRHPYELFYYLWKLSFLFGKTYADVSICFEQLVDNPPSSLSPLFKMLDIDLTHISAVEKLIVKPQTGKWKQYAEQEWFSSIESRCELVLQTFWASQVDFTEVRIKHEEIR